MDVWVMLTAPNGNPYGPVKEFYNASLNPYQTKTVPNVRQDVPVWAPQGNYMYTSYCGDYPSVKVDSMSFPFVVFSWLEGGADDWYLSGWFDEPEEALPQVTELNGNYPNPFNSSTTISYALANDAHVTIEVFNLLGQKVETIKDEHQKAGYKTIQWDASQYASGVYFYKLTADNKLFTKRMMLLK
jgi:hypothetical protein